MTTIYRYVIETTLNKQEIDAAIGDFVSSVKLKSESEKED